MSIRIYGDPYESGELAGPVKTQLFTPQTNLRLSGVALEIVVIGNPVISNLRAKIYDNNNQTDSASLLRATSTTAWQGSDLLETESYGLKIVPFSFTPFGVRSGDKFHLSLEADSYSPVSGTSYIAWRNAWPEPAYATNYIVTGINYLVAPRMINGFFGRATS